MDKIATTHPGGMMKATIYFKERVNTPRGRQHTHTFEDAVADASGPERSVAITQGNEVWVYPFEVIQSMRFIN